MSAPEQRMITKKKAGRLRQKDDKLKESLGNLVRWRYHSMQRAWRNPQMRKRGEKSSGEAGEEKNLMISVARQKVTIRTHCLSSVWLSEEAEAQLQGSL